jgi:LacI family transcriptional regulator
VEPAGETGPHARSGPAARVTILDVARAAGVMPSTVSKALNGGRGSSEVRRRVTEAATRLGYRPNQQARGLRRSESRAIGVLIPDLANPVFLPLLSGIERVAQARGYVVVIADGQRSEDAGAAALERFFDQGVDGLLLAGPVAPAAVAPYVEHGVPVAPAIVAGPDGPDHQPEHAEAAATRVMAERLVTLGHRRFGFVAPPPPKGITGRRYRRGRLGALAAVLREAGAALTVTLVDPRAGADAGRPVYRRALRDGAPTALVCASHRLAPDLLLALNQAGRRIPADLSLVVYGDSAWARAYRPALSVIRRDGYAEGAHLATALLDEIAGKPPAPPATITASYVERESCGPPPGPGQPA